MTTDATGLPRPRFRFSGLPKEAHAPYVKDGDVLPIPWVAFRSITDGDSWDALDHDRVDRCHEEGLCQVCGEPLLASTLAVRAFDLSPATEFGDQLPMHPRCARLALRRCPHLRAYGVRPRDADSLTPMSDDELDAAVLASTFRANGDGS